MKFELAANSILPSLFVLALGQRMGYNISDPIAGEKYQSLGEASNLMSFAGSQSSFSIQTVRMRPGHPGGGSIWVATFALGDPFV